MAGRLAVARGGRLGAELGDHVRPRPLGTDALLHDRLDPIPDQGSRIRLGRVLDYSLVVIDQEAAHVDEADSVLALEELDHPRDGIAGAAPQLALILDRRAERPKVGARRQSRGDRLDGAIEDIAAVGEVGDPAEAGAGRCRAAALNRARAFKTLPPQNRATISMSSAALSTCRLRPFEAEQQEEHDQHDPHPPFDSGNKAPQTPIFGLDYHVKGHLGPFWNRKP